MDNMVAKKRLKTRAEIIEEIVAFRNNGDSKISWDNVAKHFGVSKPCVYRLVKEKGYSPGVHNCQKLGMKHEVKVEVCPTHGIVHCYDCETEQVKPRSNSKPRRRNLMWYKDPQNYPGAERWEAVCDGYVMED